MAYFICFFLLFLNSVVSAQINIGVSGGAEFTDVYTHRNIPVGYDLNATKHAESFRISSEYTLFKNFSGLFHIGYLKRLPVDYYIFSLKNETGGFSNGLEFLGQPRHEQSEFPYDPEFDGGPFANGQWVFLGTGVQYSQPIAWGFSIDASLSYRYGRLLNQAKTVVLPNEVGSRILPSVLWFSNGDLSRVAPIVLKKYSHEYMASLGLRYKISETLSLKVNGEVFRSGTRIHRDRQFGASTEDKWQGFGFFGTLLYSIRTQD